MLPVAVEIAPPTVSGQAVVGKTLTASTGGWSAAPPPSYMYQWQSCDASGNGCADIVFHERLVALADSPRLSRMHSILLIETRICIRALEVSYGHGDVRFGEHRAIAQSFLDGDARLTDELLVAHMKDAVQRLTVAATAV